MKTHRRTLSSCCQASWACAVVTAMALVPAATAEAKKFDRIIPGQGMDGLKLGDTTAEVTEVLGGPISGPTDNLGGNVGFNEQAIVIELNTTSPHFKTSQGIHVGSPLSTVHATYPKAKRGSSPDGPDYSIAGTYRGKKVVTTFYAERQKGNGHNVAEIEVSDAGDQQPPGFGLTPPAAEAKVKSHKPVDLIVPGRSIGGVAFGDTKAQVVKLLGKPTGQETYPNITIFGYHSLDGTVDFDTDTGKVDGLDTFSKKFKTSKGIHVGSPLAAVPKAYPQAVQKTDPITNYPYYELTSMYAGQPVRTFFETHYGYTGISVIEIFSHRALEGTPFE